MSKELTRKAIVASFMKLLNERPLEKITVKDIVLDCGINRNTFYYHYQDIYALAADIFQREAQSVIEQNWQDLSWQEGFIQSAQFALQNKRAIYHVYNSMNRAQLEEYLFRVTDDLMKKVVCRYAKGLDVAEQDIYYITQFYKHALVGITLEWLQNGMMTEPESAIRRLGEILDGNIRSALERVSKN